MARARSASARDVRETLDGIRRLVQSLRTGARRAGNASGLSAAELFMLHALADGGPAASLNALAERTFTDQSTASPVVERLRRRRLLRRARAEDDARRVEIRITPAGRTALGRGTRPPQVALIRAIRGMPAPDRARLARGLRRLLGAMGARGPAAMLFEDAPRRSAGSRRR